ncbi:MAG: cytochrome c-type biogenesis protein [Pseudomonadota bacterium]
MRRLSIIFLAMMMSAFAEAPLPDPAEERAAQALFQELRCLVCQGQSIAESDAELAADMRALVRERIAAGEAPLDVRNYLVRRYGDWVTFSPPARGTHLILWAAPLLLVLIGGIAALRMFRRPAS